MWKIILKLILSIGYSGVNSIQLALDRVQCRIYVMTVKSLQVAQRQGVPFLNK